MEATFQSHLLDNTIYQTKYRSKWLAISDQNTLHSHCLSTFLKSVASILHTLWFHACDWSVATNQVRNRHLNPRSTLSLRSRDDKDDSKEGIPIPPSKPKIWSMAEMAVCKTPPPNSGHWNYSGLDSGMARQHPAMTAAALR